jgi:Zn-dependent protease/predicted transcriptional regulator
MARSTVTLFRVRGVPVSVSWSWILIFGLVVWSLGYGLFPASYPGHSVGAYLVMAAVGAVLFFASVLLHELGHTLVALREGVRIKKITLWLFGGVSRADEELPSPRAELRVVAAGPLTTAALTLVFWVVAVVAGLLGLPETVSGVPAYLAGINALLLVFNLVPALPLDGGRLLHALLWKRSGDRHGATLTAATAGRVFAVVLVTWGVMTVLLAPGRDLSGAWFVVLGWFLAADAQQEAMSARAEHALSGLLVRDVMSVPPQTLHSTGTIAEFAGLLDDAGPHRAYPVTDEGRLIGLMLTRSAGAVPIEDRARVSVGQVMLGRDQVPTVQPGDPVADCAAVLQHPPGRAVVVEDERVVGMLSADDLQRLVTAKPSRLRRSGVGRLTRHFPP